MDNLLYLSTGDIQKVSHPKYSSTFLCP